MTPRHWQVLPASTAGHTTTFYKAFRRVETSFVQGRNLYLAGLLLVIQYTGCPQKKVPKLNCYDA